MASCFLFIRKSRTRAHGKKWIVFSWARVCWRKWHVQERFGSICWKLFCKWTHHIDESRLRFNSDYINNWAHNYEWTIPTQNRLSTFVIANNNVQLDYSLDLAFEMRQVTFLPWDVRIENMAISIPCTDCQVAIIIPGNVSRKKVVGFCALHGMSMH